MFTLRRYTGSGVQMNQEIGREYTLVTRDHNPNDFARTFESNFKRPLAEDAKPDSEDATVYAFVGSGSFIQALYKNQTAYIMSETGQTFANVSFK